MSNVLLRWTAHPARGRPRDVMLCVAVWALTVWAVLTSLESPLLAFLAAIVLPIAIAPFLLPTRYTVTDDGIEAVRAFTKKSRRFSDLRRVEVGSRAALVTPFARPNWLDRQRGIIVFFDGADRERVVRVLKEKIQQPTA